MNDFEFLEMIKDEDAGESSFLEMMEDEGAGESEFENEGEFGFEDESASLKMDLKPKISFTKFQHIFIW